jgi:hypothetical protein
MPLLGMLFNPLLILCVPLYIPVDPRIIAVLECDGAIFLLHLARSHTKED